MHFQQHPHHQHHPHHQQHPGQGGYPGFQQGGPAGYPGQQMPPQMMGGGGFGGGFGTQQELVAFRSHHGQHLQALPDGSIKVANVGINDFERFTLEFLPDGAFYIRTPHGTYVNLEDNDMFRGVHTKHDRDSIFRFMPQPQRGPNHFALVTARGSYLQAPPGGSEWTKNSTNLGDWEVFEKISLGHAGHAGHTGHHMPGQQMPGQQMGFGAQERVAFRSHHGQQLQAHSDGSIKVVNCPINDWERFTLEYLPDGAFYIRTHHGTYVNLEDNGMFRGIPTKSDRDSVFRFMPQPQRGPNRFALVTVRGSYLQAPPGGNERTKNSTNLGDWEVFEKIV